jgi:hypothetical protein
MRASIARECGRSRDPARLLPMLQNAPTVMMPDKVYFPFQDDSVAEIDSRLEHLAAIISGNGFVDAGAPTLTNLRELYRSADPISTRFVQNLLHCAICTSNWRCDHCDYRQAAGEHHNR